MCRARQSLGLLVLAAGLAAISAGCASVSEKEEPAIGAPQFPPSNPAQVTILHTDPGRPHIKLGKVTVDASTQPPPPVQKIEAALRKEAAKMGADAVVLVYDQTQTVGAVVSGGDWGAWGPGVGPAEVTPIENRVVIGVAIKYQEAP